MVTIDFTYICHRILFKNEMFLHCERWALDALDCAKSIDSSFTINDFIHMLPEEISFREAGDLITRARSNLAVNSLIDRRRVITDTLDIYSDPILEIQRYNPVGYPIR